MSVVLKGITWEHARGFDSVVAAAAAYREVAPDVEVRWEFRSLQAFADQSIEELAAAYDLLVIDHPHIPLAAEEGVFARLDGRGFDAELAILAQQSVGRSHESYRHGGHQYGLATDAAAQVSAYRPDLLDEVPTSWDEVLELARTGRVVWPYKPIDAFSSLITVAANHGHVAMSEPGVFLPEEAAAQALGILRELASLVPAENSEWNPIQAADALSTGDGSVYCPLLFGYTNYSRAGFREHRLAYTDIPGVRGSLLGGAGIAVSAASQHIDEAVAHAFWLDSAEVQSGVYYDGGGQPGNAVAWDSERTNADSLDFFRSTRNTLENAYLRPRHPRFTELQDALSPLVTAALLGELTDHDLIARLDEGAAEYLGEH